MTRQMHSEEYDDPEIQTHWVTEERRKLIEYLHREDVDHGGVPDEPDWLVAPHLAIWRIMSIKAPGAVGWWAISGDVPTDYISSGGIPDARTGMVKFSEHWSELSQCMLQGLPHPDVKIGTSDQWPKLGDLLLRRANLLAEIAAEDENWQ